MELRLSCVPQRDNSNTPYHLQAALIARMVPLPPLRHHGGAWSQRSGLVGWHARMLCLTALAHWQMCRRNPLLCVGVAWSASVALTLCPRTAGEVRQFRHFALSATKRVSVEHHVRDLPPTQEMPPPLPRRHDAAYFSHS